MGFLLLLHAVLLVIPCVSFAQGTGGLQTKLAAGQEITYDNNIRDIISRDCGRCHSGPTNNLMDYDNLKVMVDNGMLRAMVSPGGPMSRFAGNDANTITTWIDNGAPEKAAAQPANFFAPHMNVQNTPAAGQGGFQPGVPQDQVTYENTIKYILAKDCLQCHSGTFRNLTTYNNVKYYADNGLLKTLVSRGGQMHRFAGPDSRTIISWVDNGAPQ